MKSTSTKTSRTLRKLLGTVAMGAFIAVPLLGEVSTSEAQAPRWGDQDRYQTFTGTVISNPNNDRFDIRVGNDTYNVFPSSRLPAGIREGVTVRVYGTRSGNNDIRNANVTVVGGARPGGTYDRRYDRRDENQYQTFTGVVASDPNNDRFNIRVGNDIYNVYPSSRVPGTLTEGDTVRVYGVRSGNNDIRNANVTVTSRGRAGGTYDRRDDNRYQTFTGVVASDPNNDRFNIRVGNEIYNVYPSSRVPGNLDEGDTVRVYGVRSGNNDIRNANVTVTGRGNQRDPGYRPGLGNRPGPGNRPGNRRDQAQTFNGQVTSVVSDNHFIFSVGNTTYNVYPAGRMAQRVERGDVVRVYGVRSGNNDIRNANVVIVNNRGGNQAPRANQAINLNGTVIGVQASNRFTFQSDGTVYTVTSNGTLPRNLSRGDEVRVFGLRAGNQIRSAAVTVTRDR